MTKIGFTRRARAALLGLLSAAALVCTSLSPASAAPNTSSAATIAKANDEILAYQTAHPDDLAGLEALSVKYTGIKMRVSLNGVKGILTGAQAQPYIDQAKKQTTRANTLMSGGIPAYSLRVYTVALMGPPPKIRVVGNWTFPDWWAGQAPPVDVASIGMSSIPTCMHQQDYGQLTWEYDNTVTNVAWLASANLGNNAPYWDVADKEDNRGAAMARSGNVGLTLANYCGTTQSMAATFNYAANQGGSIVSVSASYGGLSVGYSSPGLTREQGTAPVYFNN